MIQRFAPAAAILALCCVATPAQADVTGTVDATITLTTGCIINGENVDDEDTGFDFGTINFGSHTSLFEEAEGEVVGSSGIAIQCTPGVAPVLTFGAGLNDGEGEGGNRAMVHESDTDKFVGYGLYTDSHRASLIAVGAGVTLNGNGSAQSVRIYGKAFGGTALPAGTYSDTVLVTLTI